MKTEELEKRTKEGIRLLEYEAGLWYKNLEENQGREMIILSRQNIARWIEFLIDVKGLSVEQAMRFLYEDEPTKSSVAYQALLERYLKEGQHSKYDFSQLRAFVVQGWSDRVEKKKELLRQIIETKKDVPFTVRSMLCVHKKKGGDKVFALPVHEYVSSGAEGKVKIGVAQDGEKIAYKSYSRDNIARAQGSIRREKGVNKALKRPYVGVVKPAKDEEGGTLEREARSGWQRQESFSGKKPVSIMPFFSAGDLSAQSKYRALKPEYFYMFSCNLTQELEMLHSQGIVHRDIKPPNIMIHSPSGKARVVERDKRVYVQDINKDAPHLRAHHIDFGLSVKEEQYRQQALWGIEECLRDQEVIDAEDQAKKIFQGEASKEILALYAKGYRRLKNGKHKQRLLALRAVEGTDEYIPPEIRSQIHRPPLTHFFGRGSDVFSLSKVLMEWAQCLSEFSTSPLLFSLGCHAEKEKRAGVTLEVLDSFCHIGRILFKVPEDSTAKKLAKIFHESYCPKEEAHTAMTIAKVILEDKPLSVEMREALLEMKPYLPGLFVNKNLEVIEGAIKLCTQEEEKEGRKFLVHPESTGGVPSELLQALEKGNPAWFLFLSSEKVDGGMLRAAIKKGYAATDNEEVFSLTLRLLSSDCYEHKKADNPQEQWCHSAVEKLLSSVNADKIDVAVVEKRLFAIIFMSDDVFNLLKTRFLEHPEAQKINTIKKTILSLSNSEHVSQAFKNTAARLLGSSPQLTIN